MSDASDPPKVLDKVVTRVKQSKTEVTKRILELVVGAFTLVTALAWNDAVKSLFTEGGLLGVTARWGPWANAVAITLLVYLASSWAKQYISTPCTTLCAQTVTDVAAALGTTQREAHRDAHAEERAQHDKWHRQQHRGVYMPQNLLPVDLFPRR